LINWLQCPWRLGEKKKQRLKLAESTELCQGPSDRKKNMGVNALKKKNLKPFPPVNRGEYCSGGKNANHSTKPESISRASPRHAPTQKKHKQPGQRAGSVAKGKKTA